MVFSTTGWDQLLPSSVQCNIPCSMQSMAADDIRVLIQTIGRRTDVSQWESCRNQEEHRPEKGIFAVSTAKHLCRTVRISRVFRGSN